MNSCPACGATDFELLQTAIGSRTYCHECFHGWRTDRPEYAYTNTAMCSLGSNPARLAAQIEFFAPYVRSGSRVLEIGCATGELAAAARAALPIGSYEAIELSPAREMARAHLDKLHTAPLPDLLSASSIEGRFDIILMSHVLEHLADPGREIAAIIEALEGSGVLFLEVPNRGGAHALAIDDNRAHLHFFCATSLTRLLARYGLETVAAATGVKLDDRYSDSLQVIATPFRAPTWSCAMLSDQPAIAAEDSIVVWGAGSLADELLANYFDPAKIDFFVDSNPARIGSRIMGREVRRPEALGAAPRTVLVNSIDFADAIVEDIARLYPSTPHRIVRIGDLLR